MSQNTRFLRLDVRAETIAVAITKEGNAAGKSGRSLVVGSAAPHEA
jgi:hypothetical protein